MNIAHTGLCMIDQGLDKKAVSYTVLDENFSFKQPLVLYMGGYRTSTYDYACRGIRVTEKFLAPLHICRDKVKFVAMCYDGLTTEQAVTEKILHRLRKQQTLTPDEERGLIMEGTSLIQAGDPSYLHELYEFYFKPLIAKRAPDGSYEKLPVEQAMKNMRNINIVAHSHGCCVISIFGDLLDKKLHELGYTKSEAAKIEREVFVMAAGPTALLGISKFTTVNLVSRFDIKVIEGFVPRTYNRILCTQNPFRTNDCQYYKLSENESVLAVDKLCVDTTEPNKELEHSFKSYLTNGDHDKTVAGHVLSAMALNILSAGIHNSLTNRQAQDFVPLNTVFNTLRDPQLTRALAAGTAELTRRRKINHALKETALYHLRVHGPQQRR